MDINILCNSSPAFFSYRKQKYVELTNPIGCLRGTFSCCVFVWSWASVLLFCFYICFMIFISVISKLNIDNNGGFLIISIGSCSYSWQRDREGGRDGGGSWWEDKQAQREKRDTTETVSCVPLNKQPSSNEAASYHFNSVNQISLRGVYANKGGVRGVL